MENLFYSAFSLNKTDKNNRNKFVIERSTKLINPGVGLLSELHGAEARWLPLN